MSGHAARRKERRSNIKRSRQRNAEIERYLRRCEIILLPDRPMDRATLIEAMERNIVAGMGIKLHPFVRHNYTNYDSVCDYVYGRWQSPLHHRFRHEILHPKVRSIVLPWLREIGAQDLLINSCYGIPWRD
jgi:hypothetical protein